MRRAVLGKDAGLGGRALGVQSKAPGCSKLGRDRGALAVAGDILGILPERVELQLEISTLGTFLWARDVCVCVCVCVGLSQKKERTMGRLILMFTERRIRDLVKITC